MARLTDKVMFKAWMVGVDRELENVCGLDSMCIADQPWHDWFDSGMTCQAAAYEALEEEGFWDLVNADEGVEEFVDEIFGV